MKTSFKYTLLSLMVALSMITGCSKENPNPDLGTQVTEMQENPQNAPSPVSND